MNSLTIKEVREFIEKAGYKLLSDKYKNSSTYIIVQCPNGHPPYPVIYSNFYKGSRCPVCAALKRKDSRMNWSDERIKRLVEKDNYKLNRIFIKDRRKTINVTCNKNHTYDVYLANFARGSRCGFCKKKGTRKNDYEEISNYYLTHSRQDTSKKFGINKNTVSNIFYKVYECSKKDYLVTHKSLEKKDDLDVH